MHYIYDYIHSRKINHIFPTYEITSEFNQFQDQARYNLIIRVLELLRTAPTNTQAYTMGLRKVPRHRITHFEASA